MVGALAQVGAERLLGRDLADHVDLANLLAIGKIPGGEDPEAFDPRLGNRDVWHSQCPRGA